MSEHSISQCRSCHKRIIWTTNVSSGKRTPVDAEPVEQGNIILVSGNDGPESRVLTHDELAKRATRSGLYVSHFATCDRPNDWRKR